MRAPLSSSLGVSLGEEMLGRHRVTVLVFENRQAGSQRGGSSRGGGGGVRFPTWPPAPSVVLNDSLGGTDEGGSGALICTP